MSGQLLDFIIFLIVLVMFVALILWCVKHFFLAIYEPSRYVVGGLALIAILYRLRPIVGALFP